MDHNHREDVDKVGAEMGMEMVEVEGRLAGEPEMLRLDSQRWCMQLVVERRATHLMS